MRGTWGRAGYKKFQLLKTALLKDPVKTQEDLIISNVSCSSGFFTVLK